MISIIVPVYNVEKYLYECIQSIVSQSYTDWECILIDDGSTDNSGLLCDKWVKQDNRIKVIHQENQGVSVARNQGIDKAVGEFITFIDSDDWIEKDCFTTLTKHISQKSSDLYVSGIIQNFNDGTNLTYTPTHQISFCLNSENVHHFIDLNRKYLLYGPTANLYRKSIIQEYNIRFRTDLSHGEDLLFNYDYLEHINSITCIEKAYYHYRILGSGTLSSTIRYDRFDIDYKQWKVLQSFYQRKGLWNQEAKAYLSSRLWGIIYDSIFLYPKLKGVGLKYLKNILSISEIEYLKQYKELYSCSSWIKECILQRQSFLLYLFFKLKK